MLTDKGKFKVRYEVIGWPGGGRLQLCETREIAEALVKASEEEIQTSTSANSDTEWHEKYYRCYCKPCRTRRII